MYDFHILDRRRGHSERRQDRRTPFVASVLTRGSHSVALGLAQNLSITGMELLHPDGASGRLSLRFELQDGAVELDGEIVSARPHGNQMQRAGIRFVDLTPAVEERLTRAIAVD